MAEYSLRDGAYHERNLMYVVADESSDDVVYDVSQPSGSSPVNVEGGRMSFKLPLFDEPHAVFDGEGFTATRPGAFVDRWKRVD